MDIVLANSVIATLGEIGQQLLEDFENRTEIDEDGLPWPKVMSYEDLESYDRRSQLINRLNAQLGDVIQSKPHYADLVHEVVKATKSVENFCAEVRSAPAKYRPVGKAEIQAEFASRIESMIESGRRLIVTPQRDARLTATNALCTDDNDVKNASSDLAVQQRIGESRITLGNLNVVLLDGIAYTVKPGGYKLFEILLESPGEYISMAEHGLRTRDVKGLPEVLRDAVESIPGAGTRIKREYFA